MMNWILFIAIAMFGSLQMHAAALGFDRVAVVGELQFGIQRFVKDGTVVRKVPTDAALILRITNLSQSSIRIPTQRIAADVEETAGAQNIRLRLDVPDGSQPPVVIVPDVALGIAELRPNESVVIPIQLEQYTSTKGVRVNVLMNISEWLCARYGLDYFNFPVKISSE
jgi:hypothetical protein